MKNAINRALAAKKNAINRALAAKNTKVLFSALCLLVSISVCAENKKAAKSDASTKQTKVVQVEDGNVVVVNTTESGKKRATSVTVTRNGNEKRNNVYVVKSDVKSDSKTTIATSIEAEVTAGSVDGRDAGVSGRKYCIDDVSDG